MDKLIGLMIMAAVWGVYAFSGMAMAENEDYDTMSLARVELTVDNLSCRGCFPDIREAVAPLKGYSGMGTNLWRNRIAVDFLPPLTPEIIAATISELGYPVAVKSVEKISKTESFAYVDTLRRSCSPYTGDYSLCTSVSRSERRAVSCCIE